MFNDGAEGACAFCGMISPLRDSHVLPAFVYRWLRDRSGTGHIRHTDAPNRRVQDGLKLKWLCDICENKFSRYETAFANTIFYPLLKGADRVAYNDLFLKFCVSVSWRVLKYAYGRNQSKAYTLEQTRLAAEAEECWRLFLNGSVKHPGAFEQHFLLFDVIESTNITDLPPNFNRFMTGAVTLDIVGSDKSLLTFAKLGRFIIFGIIQKGPNKWDGTKVHVKHGTIKPETFTVPARLLDLFYEKAAHAGAAMATISDAQSTKIDDHVMRNIEKFRASEQFKAIVADARMFGEDAVIRKKRS